MTTPILVLEDDPVTRAELCAMVEARHFLPLAAASASQAIRRLQKAPSPPLVAIVDWDLSMASDNTVTSRQVLEILDRSFPACEVIVNSSQLLSAHAQQAIRRAHARAITVVKERGHDGLFSCISRIVTVSAGDLSIGCRGHRSYAVHVPTSQVFHHAVAHLLMKEWWRKRPDGKSMTAPTVTFSSEAEVRAVQRLADWLRQCRSTVAVNTHGHRTFSLRVMPDTEAKTLNDSWWAQHPDGKAEISREKRKRTGRAIPDPAKLDPA